MKSYKDLGVKLSITFSELYFPIWRKTLLVGLIYGALCLIYLVIKSELLNIYSLESHLDLIINGKIDLTSRILSLSNLITNPTTFRLDAPIELFYISILVVLFSSYYTTFTYTKLFQPITKERLQSREKVIQSYFQKTLKLFILSISFYAASRILNSILTYISSILFEPLSIYRIIFFVVVNLAAFILLFRYFLSYAIIVHYNKGVLSAISKSLKLISYWRSAKVVFINFLVLLLIILILLLVIYLLPSNLGLEIGRYVIYALLILSLHTSFVGSTILYTHYFFKYYDEFDDEDESESITDHLVFEDF